MSRLKQVLNQARQSGRKALIPYLTAGDPAPDQTVPLMHALVRGGADVLELGVPFSDPMADGPVIQAACERALSHGVHIGQVLEMVRRFREEDTKTPVVLMGYLNPVEAMGYERFASAAVEAGVDGVLLVDLSAEEGEETVASLQAAGLETVLLAAPTTAAQRLPSICALASGFVYYVALKGVTGAGNLDLGDLQARVEALREHTRLPVAVGFGVRDAKTAAQVGRFADAVVVGSALVALVAEHAGRPDDALHLLEARVAEMRRALDQLT